MKKLYKLTNIKLNQSFWVIIAAFVLQIIAGVVMSLLRKYLTRSPQIGADPMYLYLDGIMNYTDAISTVRILGSRHAISI